MANRKPKLRFTAEAAADVADGRAWYEARSSGMGADFRSAVRACVDSIADQPEMSERIEGEVRRALVRRIPYAAFYECADDAIVIYAVLHAARRSSLWKKCRT